MKTQAHSQIKQILSFFAILFFVTCHVMAQKIESNPIKKFTTEQGLSSNYIRSVLQDKKRIIWIATEEGLNKFDGKSFTVFKINNGRYSLSHNRAQTLYLAPDGNIWSGTSNGLNIYDYKLDSIIIVTDKTSPLKLAYNDITYITSSVDKTKTWIGTYGNGVNFFNWKNKRFYTLLLPKISQAPPPLNVMTLLEDDSKRLWIGTRHNGLYRYDFLSKMMVNYKLPESSLFIRALYQDSFRRIWVGTSKGCYIYNETTDQLESVNYPAGLNTSSIGVVKEDQNGKIWLGTELSLLSFSARSFSLTQKFAYQIINQGESNTHLNCVSINALYTDIDNNIWIGTAWGGLNMLKGTPSKFKLIKHKSESKNTLPNSPITAIYPDNEGNLFIATMGNDDFGLCLMNLQNNEVKALEIDTKFPGVVYQSVLLDSQNNLWLGTYNNGLIKTKKNSSAFKQYLSDSKNTNSIPDNDIRCLYETKEGILWVGTSNGLARSDSEHQQFERIKLTNNRIGIRCIREAKDGTLWLGTYGAGVITYNHLNRKVNLEPTTFLTHVVSDMLIQGDSVWVATQGEGLLLYDKKTRKSTLYTEAVGLSSNYVRALSIDSKGKIWFTSSKGISKLDPKTKEIENYNSQDGVQSGEFSERATVTLPNGSIAFGGFGGLNIFNPLNVTKNDKCPPVIFTRLLVFNETITPTEDPKYSPLKENITLADKIELKYNQSVFTIEFIGVNYNANQKIQYSYILEGSDKKWNHLGNQNSVTFRNLQPGTYTFKVKASSPDAIWSDANIASLIIEVSPPFWATGWAYLFYLILLATLLYFIWLFVTIRIRTANRLKIERARREKDEELHQEKLQFFTNISHEFRTPLTLIIGPLEKLHYEEIIDEKKTNLKLILRNANRLLTMVNQLLDFRKTEKGQMKLKVQNSDLIFCLNIVLSSFEELRKQKNIQLEFEQKQQNLMAWFDTEFVNKSMFNLLSNAFKFTPDGGKITLSVMEFKDAMGNNEVSISISDNGKGILDKDIHFIFDRFYQGKEQNNTQGSGIGLHLVKNLIELHHGTIEVESTPTVQTTFKINLPIEKTAYLKEELMEEFDSSETKETTSLLLDERNNDIDIQTVKTLKGDPRKKILVVEDNADIRSYIRSILENDYIIEEAENGVIGLEMATIQEIDLIISDLMMPEMDGIEMCKQIKKSIETSHIPIILLTAKSDVENRIEGLSIGADSYITKPFHPKHLTIRVQKLIELRELLKERFSKRISLGDMQKTNEKYDSPDEIFLQNAISIILNKLAETDFNGDALAYCLNISRMGLHRKLKAITGQSTGEFIRNIRLKKACELLSTHGKNISEVCYDVGFNSPSYFTTCFVEVYKVTPSEYMKNFKHIDVQ